MNAIAEAAADPRPRLGAATGAALLVAGVILVAFVLPAEYAVDPLGTGARTGLLQLGEVGKQVAALEASSGAATGSEATLLVGQARPFSHETVTFDIGPKQGIEYKYRLDKGKALLFSWKASVPVSYEFHAEPDGAPKGYAQTYEKGDGKDAASGTLTAPFPGIHGWYWENKTDQPITVTLTSSGFYNLAHEFRGGTVTNKTF